MSNGSEEAVQTGPAVSLENPFSSPVTDNAELGRYEATLQRGAELREAVCRRQDAKPTETAFKGSHDGVGAYSLPRGR